jgi:hypothetical protein
MYLLCIPCRIIHDKNAYGASHIRLQNRWTDLDETWYGRYATDGYSKIETFN